MKRKIGQLMMLVGIILLTIPGIGTLYTYYEGKKLYEAYLEELQEISYGDGQPEYSAADIEEEQHKELENIALETEKTSKQPTSESMEILGRIKIPKIRTDLLLIEGVSDQALKTGAGHMRGTAFPGELGNCAVAGHRNYTFGQIFNRLNEVKKEDEIILEYGQQSYLYKVYSIHIVKPEDISILDQPKNSKEVTLITCHPVYRATHRLIVKGKLIE